MFTRTRLPGFWTFGSTIAPAEFEHIDNYAYAIDGLNGGTYAPSALLTIGGSGLTVAGPFNATDAEYISVDTTLQMEVGSILQLSGNLLANSGAIVGITSGAFLTVASGGTFTMTSGSTANIAATTTLSGTNTLSGTTTISGTLTCSNTVALNGATTQTGAYTKSGTGAINAERVTAINAVLAAWTVSTNADVWYVYDIIAGGTSIYTVKSSTPTPPDGARMSIHAYNTGITKAIDIRREDASLIATLDPGDGGVDLLFFNSGWKLVGSWGAVTLSSVYS